MCVVGPGFDSTSPAFVRSRASQAAGSDDRLAHKTESGPHLWGQGLCRHNLCRCLQQSNLVQAVSSWTSISLFRQYIMYGNFAFLSTAIHFLYFSLEKGYTSVTSLFASVGSTGRLALLDMVPWSLMSSWCATWLELTRHGGVELVGLLEWFLIVFHALRLLFVRTVDVMTFSHMLLCCCRSATPCLFGYKRKKTIQSTDLTMVYSAGIAPREFRQTQSRVCQMSH